MRQSRAFASLASASVRAVCMCLVLHSASSVTEELATCTPMLLVGLSIKMSEDNEHQETLTREDDADLNENQPAPANLARALEMAEGHQTRQSTPSRYEICPPCTPFHGAAGLPGVPPSGKKNCGLARPSHSNCSPDHLPPQNL